MSKITVFIHNKIRKQIQSLYQRGGQFQKAADKCKALVYDLSSKQNSPMEILSKIPMTNHGESRIQHCIKYDLPGFSRLVTIQDNGWLILLYCGTHDEVDVWLDRNRGLKVGITDAEKGLFEIFSSEDITDPNQRISPEEDYSGGKLYIKLKHYWDKISGGLPALIKKALEKFETSTEEEEIFEAAHAISDPVKQEMIFDVFMQLRGGLIDEAKNRILAYEDKVIFITDMAVEEIQEVKSNDQFLNMEDLDEEDLKILMNNKDWLEWMVFMHPAQKVVVERDFKGSARLLGVSGSGKTCVVVKRAVRLAKKYKGEKILILTLNKSLSNLISRLIEKLLTSSGNEDLVDSIEVKSFWQLSEELIISLRNQKFDKRVLSSKTDKHGDTIDEVWEEFYLGKLHNNDSDVLFPVHCSLLSRSIYPQEYLKQEFDWIRSFLPQDRLNEYLAIDREGRTIPLMEQERAIILKGLTAWEAKMRDVGAIDYPGLTSELYKYIEQIKPAYRSVLVDEVQDFSTLELTVIRKLVSENENDLFLTGDIAQQVYSKHHKIRNAGITILPDSYMKILKNYRNSREILTAAYEVFKSNTSEDQYKSEDFEILNPQFANFSSAMPHIRAARSLDEEFSYAVTYLRDLLTEKEKGCIALCGYSLFEVQEIGKQLKLTVLDGETKIGGEQIYLSDLEQTKGFEFDRMIIVNVNKHVFPNPSLPEAEWFREISKFYVAMTRAKKELVISHSGTLSTLFDNCKGLFNQDNWSLHIPRLVAVIHIPRVDRLNLPKSQTTKMTGKDFLFHKRSIGTTRELQNKLLDHVQGKSLSRLNRKEGWVHMDELKIDILSKRDIPHYYRLFGPVVYKELEELLIVQDRMD